ncbi:MAG: RNA polymerase sigma factor, partial [Bryobacteraceae bacterium]
MRDEPQTNADDESIVAEFQRTGDPDAYRKMVERFQTRVFHLCLSILGKEHRAEAEDITQDIFLRVYRMVHGFRHESKFSTWLYRIAYREAVDCKARARYRMPHTSTEFLESKSADDPQARALSGERDRRLHLQMETLPDLYRAVLNLHYWMGYSVEEIGEQLGAPIGTVKSYMHRARALLE